MVFVGFKWFLDGFPWLPEPAFFTIPYRAVNDRNAVWSMTQMPEPGFFALPYKVVNDTNAVWSMTRMPSVNHTQCIRVIDHQSMTRMPEPGFFAPPYRAVNDTNAVWSMTRMQIAECISHSVHSCH